MWLRQSLLVGHQDNCAWLHVVCFSVFLKPIFLCLMCDQAHFIATSKASLEQPDTAKVLVPCIPGFNCGLPGPSQRGGLPEPGGRLAVSGLSDWLCDFPSRQSGEQNGSWAG